MVSDGIRFEVGFLVDRLEVATPAVDRVVIKELARLYR